MNRCDECKNKDSCVCVPYGCECFEIDLEKHDAKVRADAIDECITFIKEHSGEHYIDCDGYGCTKETVFNCDDWLENLRNMKEQKE